MQAGLPPTPQVIQGMQPAEGTREFSEKMHYESGRADEEVLQRDPDLAKAWLAVVREFEPPSIPGATFLLRHPRWAGLIRGKVLDAGAGTCWLTALTSKHPGVEEVHAMDLSGRFLTTTGLSVIRHLGGDETRIRFAESDFTSTPYSDSSFDTIWMVASIHHSRRPVETLREMSRVLRDDGHLIVVELPQAIHRLKQARVHFEAAERGIVTERVYSTAGYHGLFRDARLTVRRRIPLDVLTPKGWRTTARRSLRAAGLESTFAPPPYAFVLARA